MAAADPSAAPDAPITVVVVDDNAVVRLGLQQLLDNADDIVVVAEAADGEQAVAAVEEHAPDVVLLDVRMPGRLDGVTTASLVAERTAVVMLTYSDDAEVVQAAVQAGARGFLVHGDASPEEIVEGVRAAAAGRPVFSGRADVALLALVRGLGPVESPAAGVTGAETPAPATLAVLSEREREILAMIADGLDNAEIADRLVLSRHTVKNHITRIFTKLGVRTRPEAMALWWRGSQS